MNAVENDGLTNMLFAMRPFVLSCCHPMHIKPQESTSQCYFSDILTAHLAATTQVLKPGGPDIKEKKW